MGTTISKEGEKVISLLSSHVTKTRGIFSTVCTFPLLDIHGLKYVFETFTEV
jgi:hypothetical protein